MKRWSCFTAMLLFTALLSATAAPISNQVDQAHPVRVTERSVSNTGMNLELEIASPGWEQVESELDGAGLTVARYDLVGAGQLRMEGYPSVPVAGRMFRIPPRSGVVVEVINAEYETFTDVEYGAFFGDRDPGNGVAEEIIRRPERAEDSWFPGVLAEATPPSKYHDFRVANLATYPVQVNTARREVRVYHTIEVDIRFEGTDDRAALDEWPTEISEVFLPWYRTLLDWDERELDEYRLTRGAVQLVHRDNNTLREALDSWKTWKRQKGWRFEELTDADCNWNYSGIRGELRRRYREEPFEFVVIIGDADGAFPAPSGLNETNRNYGIFGDYYYTLMDDEDIYQDVIVGRISVRSSTELAQYGNKVLLYEKEPYMNDTDWFLRACGLAVCDYAGVSATATVAYAEQESMRRGYQEFETEVGMGGPSPARENLIPFINDGCSYYAFRGGISDGFQTNTIHNFSNTRMLVPAMELTCGTGRWSSYTETISEAWMRAGTMQNPTGGIVGHGLGTNSTHASFNNGLAVGGTYSVFTIRVPEAGGMIWGGREFIWKAFHPDWCTGHYSYRNFAEQINLMGDPLVWLWTAVPETLSVSCEETVQLGTNGYEVSVGGEDEQPISGAWVTLFKSDDNEEVIARGLTNGNGECMLNAPFEYTGEAILTVTAQNCIPNQAEIDVVNPNSRIGYVAVEYLDDGSEGTDGNGNGIPEAGETIGLVITAKNWGNNQQEEVEATADSEDPWIESVEGTAEFGTINAGSEAESDDVILVEFAPETQDKWVTHLEVEFTTGAGAEFTDDLPVEVRAPSFIFVEVNGSEDMDPGDREDITVEIMNVGGSNARSSQAELYVDHPYGRTVDNTGNFPAMSVGRSGSAEFTISSHEDSYGGFVVPAHVVVTTQDGNVDTVYFSIPLGSRRSSDPSGPDRYGYFGFDVTDDDYELCPDYDWVEINPDERNNDYEGEELDINDNGNNQDDALAIALPFEVQYYGEVFDTITVSSNGWAAFGNQESFYGALRNCPIPGPYGPPNMLAVYWDERANGEIFSYYDEDNHRFIIEWYEVEGRTSYYDFGNPCTFEVIIYDLEGDHVTWTGDNEILFQYDDMNRHSGYGRSMPWWTTGITNGTYDDGVMYYFYNRSWPGAISTNRCEEGLAILWTTNVTIIVGNLTGTVTDLATGDPLEGVHVYAANPLYDMYTDEEGQFEFPEMIIGLHEITFEMDCYNDTTIGNILIVEDSTTTLDYAMRFPGFELSSQDVEQEVHQDSTVIYPLEVNNIGNGLMNYSVEMYFQDPREGGGPIAGKRGGGELDEPYSPWDWAFDFELDTTEERHRGIVSANFNFYVSGSCNFDPIGPNKLYKYNRLGELVDSLDQPVPEEDRSSAGFYGMCWDGQYLYGVDTDIIYQCEFIINEEDSTEDIVLVDSWEVVDVGPKYLAYDPNQDLFFMGDIATDVYGVDRDGRVVHQFEQDFNPRGAAWYSNDPDGFNLYFIGRATGESETYLVKMNPITGNTIQVHQYTEERDGNMPSGADITNAWNPSIATFVTLLDNGSRDAVTAWIIGENDPSCFELSHLEGTLEGDSTDVVDLVFHGLNIPIGESYDYFLHFTTDACVPDSLCWTEVTVTIADTAQDGTIDRVKDIPDSWAFQGVYPNPFNPLTSIRFALKKAVKVDARVYNLLGQEVAVLAERRMQPGYHALTFEGGHLASGMYFLRFEAGPISEVRKLMLMK